ncbi:metal-dependent hydrolase family protein [Solicola gregarius]|uniref:Amidohydrolase family protein n=1 Tax=Solicola gregarius TaxID=2908642 RepID=A0AA46YJJ4_9ACTN|nr:amidohydrolase family protein [Solicola gregarius]UYM04620.1 amidohydrolase family protein [Solicola gregarius]
MTDGSRTLRIDNALVFDGEHESLSDGPVVIDNGVIVDGSDSPDTEAIDARGGVVVPGLIDAHFHAYGSGLDEMVLETTPLSYLALKGAHRLRRALGRGFTTVRDVAGGDPGLANAIREGLIAAPRYHYTGPALSQTGGHGDPRPEDYDGCLCDGHMVEVVDGVDPLRRAVRDRFRRGAHAIKIMTSGGVMSPSDPIRNPQYSAEEVRAVTEEAARRGSYVVAHAYSPEAIVHSVENGVRSIEHGNLLDAETAKVMAVGEAFLVPTLAAYAAIERRGADLGLTGFQLQKNQEVLTSGQRAIQIARDAGVRIGFGTDLMGDLESDQLTGLRLQLEAAGVLDTLRSATSVNAELIGRDDIGRIRPGARGDLVILDGNPFDEPEVLWDTGRRRTVVQGGRVIQPR